MKAGLPTVLVAILLLSPLAAASHNSGGSGVNTDWIEATYAFTIDRDLATLRLEATIDVHKMAGSSAGQIRGEFQSSGGGSAPLVAAAKTAVDTAFDATLAAIFADPGTTRQVNATQTVDSTFTTGATGAADFSPAVRFRKTAVIELPTSRTGFDYTGDQVEAALDSGARFVVEHQVRSERGWATTWSFGLPAGWVWTSFPDATVSANAREASIVVDAIDAAAPLTVGSPTKLQSKIGKAGAPRATFADERVEVRTDVGGFRDDVDGLPVAAIVVAEMNSVEVASRFPGSFPSKVDLPFISAASIRRVKAAGLIDDTDVDAAVTSLRTDVKSRLDGAFGGSTTVTARSDAASLAPSGTGPVRFLAFANMTKDLGDVEPAVARAVLEGGAIVKLNLSLSGLKGARLAYVLGLPAGELGFAPGSAGEILSPTKAQIVLDGRNLTVAPTQNAAFRLKDPDATAPTKEDVGLNVVVDLVELDTTLSGAIGGDLGSVLINVRASAEIRAIELPEAVQPQIPASVEIRYLSADTLRALRSAGGLNDSVIADLDAEFLKAVKDGVAALAPGVPVTGGVDRATLTGTGPVALRAAISFRQPLAGGAPTAAAMVITEMSQAFELSSLQGRDTTYEVVLPKGLALTALAAPGATTTIGEKDGRAAGTVVVPAGQSTTATATLGITPGLVWELFPGVVIAAVIVAVLLVALPVWGIVRLVKRK